MKFPIVPIDTTTSILLAVIAALPVAITVFVMKFSGSLSRFPSTEWSITFVAAVVVPALVTILLGYFLYGGHRSSVTFADAGLDFRVPVYGRSIPLDDIDRTGARVINMKASSEIRLGIRVNGVGLPGYLLGWFRFVGGGRALVALTDRSSVAYVPLNNGTKLLMSIEDPQAFLEALQTAGSP